MKYLVIGAGISGLGAAKWLRTQGHNVTIADKRTLSVEELARIAGLHAKVHDETNPLLSVAGFEHMIVSPGVPPSNPLLKEAHKLGIPVSSELDLVLPHHQGKIALVTGTNGKSTVCAMLNHILRDQGVETTLVGNIGTPPTELAAENRLLGTLVVEVSSYQLATSHNLPANFAVITNLTQDHLAYHGNMEEYLRSKLRVFNGLHGLGLINPNILEEYPFAQSFVAEGNIQIIDPEPNPLFSFFPFRHDQWNASVAAIGAKQLAAVTLAESAESLKKYKSLEHRCEHFLTWGERRFINDSKATNVDSTVAALSGQKSPLLLWLGGQGKGESFRPVAQAIPPGSQIICFGASGQIIADQLSEPWHKHVFPTLRSAMAAAKGIIEGNTETMLVLFSPGCASFDEFNNFEERGRAFKEGMRQLFS